VSRSAAAYIVGESSEGRHAFFNQACKRTVHVFSIGLQGFRERRGGFRSVLEQVKVELCLLFAEPEVLRRIMKSSSSRIITVVGR
jgi:hypothetical protein